jgi:hypothetical protein
MHPLIGNEDQHLKQAGSNCTACVALSQFAHPSLSWVWLQASALQRVQAQKTAKAPSKGLFRQQELPFQLRFISVGFRT